MRFNEKYWCRLLTPPVPAAGNDHDDEAEDDESCKEAFGIRYTFTLLDKPGETEAGADGADEEGLSAVNAPEWLVPLGDPLHRLVKATGWQLPSAPTFTSSLRK